MSARFFFPSTTGLWDLGQVGGVMPRNGYYSGLVGAITGIGYRTGAGGSVTQATSKATGVTLNKASGAITMNAAALAATTTVSFTLTNGLIGVDDTVICHRKSGGTAAAYQVWIDSVAAGSCVICVRNITAGSLSEAVVLQFSVVNGATS
jgi:hypothetical protein